MLAESSERECVKQEGSRNKQRPNKGNAQPSLSRARRSSLSPATNLCPFAARSLFSMHRLWIFAALIASVYAQTRTITDA